MPRNNPLLAAALALLLPACAPLTQLPGVAAARPFLGYSHFLAADGAVLPVRAWRPAEPAKAVVVALHGFNDYSRFFDGAGQYLARQGFVCYAYDQRGFGHAPGRGLWAGGDAYVDDLRDFVAQARQHHPGVPLYVLGESMGGAVAIIAMASPRPPAADGVILAAPAVWGRSTMPWYQRALLETLAHAAPGLRLTGEGLKIMASDNIEMLRGLGRDPLVIKATRVDAMYGLVDLMDAAFAQSARLRTPTLVLYGQRDQIIPREPVQQMLAALPPAQTRAALYPDGYHMLLRDLRADQPLGDIAAWLQDHQAPLPSGAERQPAPAAASTWATIGRGL